MTVARSTSALTGLAMLVLVVVALYFGKPILMPVALATLLAFLLNPVVSSLVRSGLRQSISVTMTNHLTVVAHVFPRSCFSCAGGVFGSCADFG